MDQPESSDPRVPMSRRQAVRAAAALIASACMVAPGVRAAASDAPPLVLVAGATGRTGVHAVEHALKLGYRVRAMTRNAEAAGTRFGSKVEVVAADVRDPASLAAAVKDVTYVVGAFASNSGREPNSSAELVDYKGTQNLVEASKAAGVKHFVLITAMGVTQPDHPLNRSARNILLWKALGENTLRFSPLNYTIVRPGGLLDGPGGARLTVSQGDTFRDWSAPRGVRPAMDRADLAEVSVRALGRPELFGRTFEVTATADKGSVDWPRLFAGLKPDAAPQSMR
jgi:uncharacterized protein YbjT (DUF2867 family)